MANVRVVIEAAAATEQLGLLLERKFEAAALVIEQGVIRKIRVGQPVRRLPSGRLIGLNPSRPGEPPKVLYGRLLQSITHEVVRDGHTITARVGTNVIYGRRLELGFVGTDGAGRNVSFAPRPYLRPSLTEAWGRIQQIMSRS